MEVNKTINKKQRIYLIVGIVLFLILVLSASYAYFAITSINNATTTTIIGNGEALGTPTLTTNTTSLSLILTSELMSEKNSNSVIYATLDGSGIISKSLYNRATTISTGNGRYVLATASLFGGDVNYNCTYNFDVSATVTKAISDGSDQDVYVSVTSPKGEVYKYRLSELLAGTKTVSGTINNLKPGENQEFLIDSFVHNLSTSTQDGLVGNEYSITVTPKSGTSGFSCTAVSTETETGFAKNLIDSNKMIQTGYEGDGYRFVGKGEGTFCSYDNGNYIDNTNTSGTCPTLYNTTETEISSGNKYVYLYDTSCSTSNDGTYSYTCETKAPTTITNQDPSNYVCFGTTNKSDCTSNPDKYMYRIVGVFPDEYGIQHVKLIKSTTIGSYAYHSSAIPFLEWSETDLYKGLNGSYFLTNTTYDYMQNNTWKNKIADWRWSSYNAAQSSRGSALDAQVNWYSVMSNNMVSEIYNMESNNTQKIGVQGIWKYNTAKIGLLKYSDYEIAHPSYSLLDVDINTASEYVANSRFISSNWIHQNKTTGENEWTLLALSNFANTLSVYTTYYKSRESSSAYSYSATVGTNKRVRPVFYLESNVELGSGTGTETDPYILK